MEIEKILDNGEKENIVAFLNSYIATSFSNTDKDIPKIKNKEIESLIVQGPKSYIDPICIKACENLWNKNIYVIATVNINKDLFLIFDKLSKENMKIFRDKQKKDSNVYCDNIGKEKYLGIKITDYLNQKNLENKINKMLNDFEMQDIQRGYLTEKTFLMNICDCEKVEGLKEYKKQEIKVVFDIQKMDKSFKEYLKESGYEKYYIPKEHRIYLNEFFYNAHQNYINKINN